MVCGGEDDDPRPKFLYIIYTFLFVFPETKKKQLNGLMEQGRRRGGEVESQCNE